MINVALIGCGYWGPNLARNLFDNPRCRLVWCCDLRLGRLKAMKNRHPTIKITTDYKDVLKDPAVDAVAIATPLQTHYPLAKQFLESGRNVLVEKPFTHSVRTAQELKDLAEKKRRVLMVGYTYIYSPYVQKIKSIVDAGTIGNLCYIQSTRVHFGHLKSNEGVLWDLTPHDIAVMVHCFNLSRCDISCSGSDHFGRGHHDTVSLNITSPGGPGVYVFASLLAPIKSRNMIVAGTKKMIFYNDTRLDEKIKIFNQCAVSSEPASNGDASFRYKTGHIYSPHVSSREPLQLEIEDFVRCIEKSAVPMSGAPLAIRVLKLLETAERSMRYGKTIKGVLLG